MSEAFIQSFTDDGDISQQPSTLWMLRQSHQSSLSQYHFQPVTLPDIDNLVTAVECLHVCFGVYNRVEASGAENSWSSPRTSPLEDLPAGQDSLCPLFSFYLFASGCKGMTRSVLNHRLGTSVRQRMSMHAITAIQPLCLNIVIVKQKFQVSQLQ